MKIEANYDEVICPNCVAQFRAIPVNVQDELRELRAALQERDAEIAALRSSQQVVVTRLEETGQLCATQRKVLEQAKAALEINRVMGADADGNYTVEITPKVITAAITAIQGGLK